MAHVAGTAMSLPWESRYWGWVTKSEFDVWTWRRWKVLLGVQSTAYAGLLGAAVVDLIESLCAPEIRKGSTHQRDESWERTAGNLGRRAAQRYRATIQAIAASVHSN